MKLTEAQIKALRLLAEEAYCSPASIGYAAAKPRPCGVPMKPQGAGRVGGGIASRLVRAGLAKPHTVVFRNQVWPVGYAVTPAGRAALQNATDGGD